MKQRTSLVGDQRGSLLMEVLIAVVIFSLAGAGVLGGLSMAHRSGGTVEGQSVAENLARNQLEYVFSLPYQAPTSTYPSMSVPQGYGVTSTAQQFISGVANIEKVVVTVSRDGQTVVVLETLRLD